MLGCCSLGPLACIITIRSGHQHVVHPLTTRSGVTTRCSLIVSLTIYPYIYVQIGGCRNRQPTHIPSLWKDDVTFSNQQRRMTTYGQSKGLYGLSLDQSKGLCTIGLAKKSGAIGVETKGLSGPPILYHQAHAWTWTWQADDEESESALRNTFYFSVSVCPCCFPSKP